MTRGRAREAPRAEEEGIEVGPAGHIAGGGDVWLGDNHGHKSHRDLTSKFSHNGSRLELLSQERATEPVTKELHGTGEHD